MNSSFCSAIKLTMWLWKKFHCMGFLYNALLQKTLGLLWHFFGSVQFVGYKNSEAVLWPLSMWRCSPKVLFTPQHPEYIDAPFRGLPLRHKHKSWTVYQHFQCFQIGVIYYWFLCIACNRLQRVHSTVFPNHILVRLLQSLHGWRWTMHLHSFRTPKQRGFPA